MGIDVVWFKKDLRVHDHLPLIDASKSSNKILCLYVIEDERFQLDDTDDIHIQWEMDNAIELSKSLQSIGGSLHFKVGDIIEIFEEIHFKHKIERVLSHEETGNSWSYKRDIRFNRWCGSKGIQWLEFPTNGIIRGLEDRDFWKKERDKRMKQNLEDPPNLNNCIIYEDKIPDLSEFGIEARDLDYRPEPGTEAALSLLERFLYQKAKNFQWGISSPVNAVKYGSGLSPYFTVGAISMQRVVQLTNERMNEIKGDRSSVDDASAWLRNLASFRKRLAWRCHFMQKLEMESNLDIVAQNQIIDRNLGRKLDSERFNRWINGTTGWPFLDACMRQLKRTGWINFRMRAMIMSCASYNLWLPWRECGCYLATQFIDYEPGIHWSQVGMQSGTTGINTIRAYSMTKQGKDQDSEGNYIRKWVPELSNVPTKYIHEPWGMPLEVQHSSSCIIGIDYPEPILDEVASRKEGVKRSYAARSSKESREQSEAVLKKHGSRTRPRRRKKSNNKSVQTKLF